MDVTDLDRSLEQGIKRLFISIWQHWFAFGLTATVVFSALMIGVLRIPPVYEGSTLLIGGPDTQEVSSDATRKTPESSVALARVAESEEVVGEAIDKIGLKTLTEGMSPKRVSLFERLRATIFPDVVTPHPELPARDIYLPRIKQALSVRGEPTSNIIRIAFRDHDPVIAAQFANAVAQTFVGRQIALQTRPGAATFFLRQRERFDNELKLASDALDKFSIETGIFAAGDQRELLLKRLNDISASLARSRGTIADKAGQRQALANQLRKLAPVARSSYVSSLVESLAADDSNGRAARASSSPEMTERASDPPLLLVRVYQDSMTELFKVNAELAGLENLQRQQIEETARLSSQLNSLSKKEQEYAALRRAVDQATYNSDLYARRMVEEQITAESNAAKLSSVKVLQKATVPVRPVFPNYILATLVAAALSATAGAGVALLMDRKRLGAARSVAA